MDFASAWRGDHENGEGFCVEARIGRFRQISVQRYLDFCFDGGVGYATLGMVLCGQLQVCTNLLIGIGSYEIECSRRKNNTLICFRVKDTADQN